MFYQRFSPIFVLLLFGPTLFSQIISTNPVFPRALEPVTITFDASEGNGGLAGLPAGTPVYAHTGITTPAGRWQYVVGNWGTADSRVQMTRIGDTDRYQISFVPYLLSWYSANNNDGANIPTDTEITEMSFVFRNVNGSKEGKTADNADIFVPVYPPGSDLIARLIRPEPWSELYEAGDTIAVFGASSKNADLRLTDNGQLLTEVIGNDSLLYTITVSEPGLHELIFEADDGNTVLRDTFYYSIREDAAIADPPPGTQLGATYLAEDSVRLAFLAPGMRSIYVLGDFNNWAPSPSYLMRKAPNDSLFWLDVGGLEPGAYHRYQYLVNEELRVADMLSELVLDPQNDEFIPEATFPDLPAYPEGKASGIVSLLRPGWPAYDWQVSDFKKPPQEELVVYELLVRDFIDAQNFQTLKDTLDYLQRLGVNAIELMPVSEFGGNLSWGYDPKFHMALDKYYGSPEAFKALVDEAHARGIAVILDVVFNHGDWPNPMASLWWDAENNRPAADNPFFNPIPRHAFNVFLDFNHESAAFRAYLDRCVKYWIEEYRVDGYRFDLTKGFTQDGSGPDDQVNGYNPSRIANIKRIADLIWTVDPEFYIILEHFTSNTEEKELVEYGNGMMVWGNHNFNYSQAAMGYDQTNFSGMSYQNRNMDRPGVLGYMESHDEERLMYKSLEFGNSSGDYDTQELGTALQRVELAANFFLTIPGPKMIWQFGELGYDFSLFWCNGSVNEGDDLCKLAPKPIRWDWLDDDRRSRLFQVFADLNNLRQDHAAFHTADFTLDVGRDDYKRIHLNHPEMDVTVLGNFSVTSKTFAANFQHTGWWYEFYSGDSLNVSDPAMMLTFAPGEYRLYTDVSIGQANLPTSVRSLPASVYKARIFPNPSHGQSRLDLHLRHTTAVRVDLYAMSGQIIRNLFRGRVGAGEQQLPLDLAGLPPGLYWLRLNTGDGIWQEKVLIH